MTATNRRVQTAAEKLEQATARRDALANEIADLCLGDVGPSSALRTFYLAARNARDAAWVEHHEALAAYKAHHAATPHVPSQRGGQS